MPEVQDSIEIAATPKECHKIVWDFAKYPEFVDGVKSTKVAKKKPTSCEVDFLVSLIKEVDYSIKASCKPGEWVKWDLIEGGAFTKNSGRWDFEELDDGLTLATYTLDIEFALKVPKLIAKKLVGSSLPSMLKTFKKRIEA